MKPYLNIDPGVSQPDDDPEKPEVIEPPSQLNDELDDDVGDPPVTDSPMRAPPGRTPRPKAGLSAEKPFADRFEPRYSPIDPKGSRSGISSAPLFLVGAVIAGMVLIFTFDWNGWRGPQPVEVTQTDPVDITAQP